MRCLPVIASVREAIQLLTLDCRVSLRLLAMTNNLKEIKMTTSPPPKAQAEKTYLHATMHEFKTHIAAYMRALENGRADGVVLKRYHKAVALVLPISKRT